MYLLLGIGISNIEVIKKLNNLKIKYIVVCKQEELNKAIKYSSNVITYEMIKYLNLDKIKYVIKSPGIPYYNKYVVYLKDKRLKVINEIELTYILTKGKGKYIGVSGSVGKSSVVSILYEQVKSHTSNVILAGNIGIPLVTYLDKINKDTIIILELSSFHLDDFVNMKLNIALLTNISDNHLDVYKTKQRYYLSKFKLSNNQSNKDYFLVNLDDKITKQYISSCSYKSKLIDYKLGFKIEKNHLYYYKNKAINLDYYFLLGEHNLDNLKSVIVILSILKMDINLKSLAQFKPLDYHLQENTCHNLLIVNDSKSTCISSLKSAIETYKDKNIILLFGGYNKKLNFSFLNNYSFKYLICFGNLSNEIDAMARVDIKFVELRKAIYFALNIASENDVILFSPGCASFDEFDSYIQRGEMFNKYIKEYFDD